MSKPYRCPVCGGTGLVPNGFYRSLIGKSDSTSTAPETCRSCSGCGIVWSPEEALSGEDYPVLRRIWDNQEDAAAFNERDKP